MPVLQDESKKGGASRTIIRRRAATVVGTPKGKPAGTAPEQRAKGPAHEGEEPKRSAPASSAVSAKATTSEEKVSAKAAHAPEAAAGSAPVATAQTPTETPAPSTPTRTGYQARIVSRPPPPPKGLPKQDLAEDDIAKDLVAASLGRVAKPGEKPAVVVEVEDPNRKHGKRRHEISRKTLQEERDSFGRMNRTKNRKKKTAADTRQTEITTPKAIKRVIRMEDHITVGDLAKRMGVKAGDLIKKLFDMGMMVTVNQNIDFDTTVLVSTDFGFEVQQTGFEEETVIEEETDTPESLKPRAPIVTVMGHVDHGKTTLLDAIRKADVAGGEAGGITQHIGAYEVHLEDGKKVTFLDTPGHAAFSAMRARGAKVTDIVILVVAADDGIMPQTIEAINHAQAAKVPIIVAINKVDKPGAEPEKIKKMLTEHGLIPEEWGGTTIILPVSAKTRQGLPELLETLALQAEIMELKSNPDKRAKGAVIEARLERGRGPVATLIVSDGTLNIGDAVVIGQYYGRVRAMSDYLGRVVKSAGPASPVEVQGLNGVPEAGDTFSVLKDEKEAKLVAEHRARKVREHDLIKSSKVSLDQLYAKIQEGDVKEVRAIVKADVQGSAEALSSALKELSTDAVKLVVLHAGAGAITESDVNLASASDSVLIGFNVRPEPKARALAESTGVTIKVYSIIYEVLNDIHSLMEGKLAPTLKENFLGRAEVRETFRISKIGMIAGCMVVDGKINRSAKVRLLRDNVVILEGKISSLKRFKDDAREVAQGADCGIGIENFNDIKVGDVIEAYVVEEIATKMV